MFVAQRVGSAVALEGLASILVINLVAAYGEEVAIATLGEITANAAPVAHLWHALASVQHQEPGHA